MSLTESFWSVFFKIFRAMTRGESPLRTMGFLPPSDPTPYPLPAGGPRLGVKSRLVVPRSGRARGGAWPWGRPTPSLSPAFVAR